MAEVERSEALANAAARAGIPRPLLERVLGELEGILRLDPEAGAAMTVPGLRVMYTQAAPPSVPPFAVVYSYDGRTCRLLAIRRALRPS